MNHCFALVFIILTMLTGRDYVCCPGRPWAGQVLGLCPGVRMGFFVLKMRPLLEPKKILLAGHLAILEPTCPFSEPNLAPKTEGKSMVLGVQEPTYVARAENVKICTTLKRKPCFCLPRTLEKPPKIYQKSILTASYVEVVFQHP